MKENEPWYGVKVVFQEPGYHFEERVVIIKASDFEHAQAQAIKEARNYIKPLKTVKFIAIVEIFHMFENSLGDKKEVYSNITKSKISPDDYLKDRYEKWDGKVAFRNKD